MILHLDMDAFFAAVEQKDNPELKGKPVIIGGKSVRAVVSTASYEARVFGVHSAMPLFQARKLCPHGVFLQVRMKRYKEISHQVFSLLQDFSPLVEPVSIDEAYLDVAGCERILGTPLDIAKNIKKKIWETTGLTCSIGISPLKFLSKIASDMNKPDGITLIRHDEMMDVINRLPIKKVPGVGASTFRHLELMGVKTLGDVAAMSDKVLCSRIGSFGARLKELSMGIDRSVVTPFYERKSYSTETTLDEDTLDRNFLKHLLLAQADEVARMLRKNRTKARIVTLKITFADFRQITRRHTLTYPTQGSDVIFEEACRMFDNEDLPVLIRLIGLGSAGLVPENHPVQAELFEDRNKARHDKWESAERVMDSILKKFGKETVRRAVHSRKESEKP